MLIHNNEEETIDFYMPREYWTLLKAYLPSTSVLIHVKRIAAMEATQIKSRIRKKLALIAEVHTIK